jgi:hypothetical protein
MTEEQLHELIEKRKKAHAKQAPKVEEVIIEEPVVVEEEIDEVERLKRKIEKLETNLEKYEQNGIAKLYYSLNRKANEMADLMNGVALKDLDIDDPKSKSFDRLRTIWGNAAEIALSLTQLGQMSGILKADKKPEESKPFVDLIAQDRR